MLSNYFESALDKIQELEDFEEMTPGQICAIFRVVCEIFKEANSNEPIRN